jgi:hypothetical protein
VGLGGSAPFEESRNPQLTAEGIMRMKTLAVSCVAVAVAFLILIAGSASTGLASTATNHRSGHSLDASIIGPSTVKPNVTCLYQANVTGGTPPYDYDWSAPGGSSSSSTFDYSNVGAGAGYTITLTVTDDDDAQVQDHLHVTTSSSAPVCPS